MDMCLEATRTLSSVSSFSLTLLHPVPSTGKSIFCLGLWLTRRCPRGFYGHPIASPGHKLAARMSRITRSEKSSEAKTIVAMKGGVCKAGVQ